MGCSDWAEILCGNISRVVEHPLKISHDLHARFGRCLGRAFYAKFGLLVAGLE